MKQVMCINNGEWWSDTTDEIFFRPKYGEVCGVVKEVEEDGCIGYILAEYPLRGPFITSLFIPLSNSSVEIAEEVMEKELVETYF